MKNKKRKAWKRQKTSYEIGTDRITSLAIQGNLHVLKDNEVYLMHNNMALVSAKMYEALTGNKPMTTSDILIPKTLLDEYEKFKCKLICDNFFNNFGGHPVLECNEVYMPNRSKGLYELYISEEKHFSVVNLDKEEVLKKCESENSMTYRFFSENKGVMICGMGTLDVCFIPSIKSFGEMLGFDDISSVVVTMQKKLLINPPSNESKESTDEDIEKLGTAEKAVAYANYGIMAKRSGDNEKAIDYYKKSISVDPKCGMAYYNLGKVLYLSGKYEEAKRAYYLAYIYNSKYDVQQIYRHIGHAVIDTTQKIQMRYGEEMLKYREGISGKTVDRMESKQYLRLCIKAGIEVIEKINCEDRQKNAMDV